MTLLQTESKDLPLVWQKAYPLEGYYNSLQMYQEVVFTSRDRTLSCLYLYRCKTEGD